MNHQNTLVLVASLIWLSLKITLLKMDYAMDGFNISVMVNMLLIILVMSGGLYLHYRSGKATGGSFLGDLKIALQSGGKYLLLFLGGMALYYGYLDRDFLSNRKNIIINQTKEHIADEEIWAQIVASDAQLKEVTKEEYLTHVTDNAEVMNSLQTFLTFSTLLTFMMALTYALVIVALFRFVLFKTFHDSNRLEKATFAPQEHSK